MLIYKDHSTYNLAFIKNNTESTTRAIAHCGSIASLVRCARVNDYSLSLYYPCITLAVIQHQAMYKYVGKHINQTKKQSGKN